MEGSFSKRREKLPIAEASNKTPPQTNDESAKRYRDNMRIHSCEKYERTLAAKRHKRKLVKATQLMATTTQQEKIREPRRLRRSQRSKRKTSTLCVKSK
jgi:hypothetical protein